MARRLATNQKIVGSIPTVTFFFALFGSGDVLVMSLWWVFGVVYIVGASMLTVVADMSLVRLR